ncbi:MAG: UbiD family decarboxylase [Candidatus Binatia bacterium]
MKEEHQEFAAALDLRVFLERLKAAGELQEIQGCHWNLEIGALTEIFAESPRTPALLFDGITGYPRGFRILSNILMSPVRESLALGVSPNVTGIQLVKMVKNRLADFRPIPPVEVGEAPLLENSKFGDDVNVLRFPVPQWHEKDGGRYIGTFDSIVCRDPDTGYVNVGTYRIQVHDEKHVGLFMVPGKHGDLIAKKYWARGQECPFVIACGIPPSLIVASAVGIPWSMSEYDFLGGLLGVPIAVIKGMITDLPMPAFAEIALEGYAPPPGRLSREEGPFGEWPGYYASGSQSAPVVRVEAIYHRGDPILTGAPPLKTYLNNQIFLYIRSANIWSALERAGLPEIRGVWFPRQGRFVVVVAIRQRFTGHAKQAGYGVLSTRDGGRDVRMVIVVDDDIDITNIHEVLWAVSSRWDPKTASEIVDVAASSLNPRLSPETKKSKELLSSCIIMDACKPYSWIKEFPPVSAVSLEYKRQILRKWAHLKGLCQQD